MTSPNPLLDTTGLPIEDVVARVLDVVSRSAG